MATTRNVKWVVLTGTTSSSSTPVVAQGRLFLDANDDKQGVFKCLDLRTGRLLWKYTAPHREVPRTIDGDWPFRFGHYAPQLGICSSPAVPGRRVYFVNHRCEVACLDIDAAPAATGSTPRASAVPVDTSCLPEYFGLAGRMWKALHRGIGESSKWSLILSLVPSFSASPRTITARRCASSKA